MLWINDPPECGRYRSLFDSSPFFGNIYSGWTLLPGTVFQVCNRIWTALMSMHLLWRTLSIFLALFFIRTGTDSLKAATLWGGPPVTFTKAPFADPTQAGSQDRLTANVWLTRGNVAGLYNAKAEAFYTANFSPQDTEWAFGVLSNYASLTYTNWERWFGGAIGGGPSSTVDKDAVLHLKTDDIYLAIKFLTWDDAHNDPGGGFSYVRSSPGGSSTPAASVLINPTVTAGESFRFSFTNAPGLTFTAVASSDLTVASSNWTVVGSAIETAAGQYQFTDPGAVTNNVRRFYRIRSP
jgi:hypothetical protein